MISVSSFNFKTKIYFSEDYQNILNKFWAEKGMKIANVETEREVMIERLQRYQRDQGDTSGQDQGTQGTYREFRFHSTA